MTVNFSKPLVFATMLVLAPGTRTLGLDASFACKALLCGQTNWPAIPYCVPIMQQAMWLNYLGIGVGICAEAMQGGRQNRQHDADGQQNAAGQARESGGGTLTTCPSGAVSMSAAKDRYVVDVGGSLCAKPLTAAAKRALAECAASLAMRCSRKFTAEDVSVN